MPAVHPLALLIVHVDDDAITALVSHHARERVRDLTSAWQPHAQEGPVVVEGDAPTADKFSGLLHCPDGGAIKRAPKSHRLRVRVAPGLLTVLDLGFGRGVVSRCQLTPCTDAAH